MLSGECWKTDPDISGNPKNPQNVFIHAGKPCNGHIVRVDLLKALSELFIL